MKIDQLLPHERCENPEDFDILSDCSETCFDDDKLFYIGPDDYVEDGFGSRDRKPDVSRASVRDKGANASGPATDDVWFP